MPMRPDHAARPAAFGGLSLVSWTVVAAAAAGQDCAWEHRVVAGPEARSGVGMVHDAARGVAVLFGGVKSGPIRLGDTWEWDGSAWTQVSTSGLGGEGRSHFGIAYDSTQELTFVFGGMGPVSRFNNDLWQWDGVSWTMAPVSGDSPQARNGAAMAFDAARGVLVLFGGETSSAWVRDTWEYDGSAWTRVATSGPSARAYAAMAYDPVREVTVLFGGGPTPQEDTWEWDGVSWASRSVSAPPERSFPAMTYDSDRQAMVVFGGTTFGPTSYDDTWQFDGATWAQLDASGPSRRYSTAFTFDADRNNAVLFGGLDGSRFHSDTWVLTCAEECYADCDGSGSLDLFDFLCFQNDFAASAPSADCDASGALDFFDFLCFQNAFAAGCP